MAYESLIGLSLVGVVLIAVAQLVLAVMRTLTLIKIRKHICSSVKSPTRTIEEELGKVPQPEKVIKEIRIKKPFGRPKKTPKQIEEERYQKEQEMIAMQELVEKENKRKKLKAELAALEDNVA